jgi:hypothetical protein
MAFPVAIDGLGSIDVGTTILPADINELRRIVELLALKGGTVRLVGANLGHTTVASAIAAGSAGDIIFLTPGTYAESNLNLAGMHLMGLDPYTCIISGTVDESLLIVTGGNYICNVALRQLPTPRTTNHGNVRVIDAANVTGNIFVDHCHFKSNGIDCIYITSSTANVCAWITNCFFDDLNAYAIYGGPSGTNGWLYVLNNTERSLDIDYNLSSVSNSLAFWYPASGSRVFLADNNIHRIKSSGDAAAEGGVSFAMFSANPAAVYSKNNHAILDGEANAYSAFFDVRNATATINSVGDFGYLSGSGAERTIALKSVVGTVTFNIEGGNLASIYGLMNHTYTDLGKLPIQSTMYHSEYGNKELGIHKTVITITSTSVAITDTGGAAGGHGFLETYNFPEGYIKFLGASCDLEITASGGIGATATARFGIGSAQVGVGDATLTGTEQDIINEITKVLVASAGDLEGENGTDLALDGTATAIKAYLNFCFADADISTHGVLVVSGTVTLHWINLGDY